jgi:maleylpyruvate isomerase
MTAAPEVDIARVEDAQRRFLEAVADLDDEVMERPSLLPDWTVAHVLTHVARNADSHVRRAEAARRGETIDQYPGGYAGRAAEIDAGAQRPANAVLEDVHESAARLRDAWAALPDPAWSVVTRDIGGRERPLSALPARRWQELEVHVVDLGTGVTYRQWPDEFVRAWLPRLRSDLAARLPDRNGSAIPAPGSLDERDELAWLYGRLRRDDLPALTPWA